MALCYFPLSNVWTWALTKSRDIGGVGGDAVWFTYIDLH